MRLLICWVDYKLLKLYTAYLVGFFHHCLNTFALALFEYSFVKRTKSCHLFQKPVAIALFGFFGLDLLSLNVLLSL